MLRMTVLHETPQTTARYLRSASRSAGAALDGDGDDIRQIGHEQAFPPKRGHKLLYVVLAILIAGCGTSAHVPDGAVRGSLHGGDNGNLCETNCSNDVAGALKASSVYCRWHGNHVYVHIRLRNTLKARVKLLLTPRYKLDRGGVHGDSYTSGGGYVVLSPGQQKDWTNDAGKPQGVTERLPITSCEPALFSIEIA